MRQLSSTLTYPNDLQMHVSNDIVSNSKPIWVVWSFIIYRYVKDPQTNQLNHQPLLTGSWLRSSQERLHWIHHAQEASPRFSWPPSITVKCQGLKTWVRVLQRQECQRPQRPIGPISTSVWPSRHNSLPAKQSAPRASAWHQQLTNTQEKNNRFRLEPYILLRSWDLKEPFLRSVFLASDS